MLQVEGLTKLYGPHLAIEDVSFQVQDGEILGLLGLNGAGKTTVLRILAGDLTPSSGEITLDGRRITATSPEGRGMVGFLPETPPVYPEMTVRGFLEYVAALRRVPAHDIPARLEDVIHRFDLVEVLDRPTGVLSHGYRKRLGLAQVMIHDPSLLLLDEPISGLDPVQIVEVRHKIRELSGWKTVILSSHILSEIRQVCDRILVVHRGRVVAQGTEAELMERASGGFEVDVEVRRDHEAAREAILGIDGVREVTARPSEAGGGRLHVVSTRDLREEISRVLVERGCGLLELSPAHDELERVFMNLTGGTRG